VLLNSCIDTRYASGLTHAGL